MRSVPGLKMYKMLYKTSETNHQNQQNDTISLHLFLLLKSGGKFSNKMFPSKKLHLSPDAGTRQDYWNHLDTLLCCYTVRTTGILSNSYAFC